MIPSQRPTSRRPTASPSIHCTLTPRALHAMQSPATDLDVDVWGRRLWVERPLLLARADGRGDLFATVDDVDAVARWVLQFGSHLTVASPDVVREAVRRHAEALWLRHARSH